MRSHTKVAPNFPNLRCQFEYGKMNNRDRDWEGKNGKCHEDCHSKGRHSKGEGSQKNQNHKGKREFRELRIASWNIRRGILNKKTEIGNFITQYNIDMLFLLETDIEHFDMRTYASFIPIVPRVSPGRKIRIVLLVRPNLIENITVCTHLMEENVPTIWIYYKNMNERTVVGGIYRERRSDDIRGDIQSQRERLLVILDQIRSGTNKPGVKIVVLGDWNLDMNRRKDKSYSLRGLFNLVDTVV